MKPRRSTRNNSVATCFFIALIALLWHLSNGNPDAHTLEAIAGAVGAVAVQVRKRF